jgi:hypothetical protein
VLYFGIQKLPADILMAINSLLLLQIIPRTTPAFRQVPDNIFKGTFQIAGLAMQAVAEVNSYSIVFQFIDAGRAKKSTWRSVI